jgi:2-keto-4-pentenoate hydratase/2-oxohepta-3-ene-1,7-dioic acid hydratase in catechol pathway
MKNFTRAVTHTVFGAASVLVAATTLAATTDSSTTAITNDRLIAPIEQAMTVSQVSRPDGLHTILIVEDQGEEVLGIDLSVQLDTPLDNLFEVIDTLGREKVKALYQRHESLAKHYSRSSLDISGVLAEKHVATGANYADHAEESDIGSVFIYPKYSAATGADTPIAYKSGELLDYEVEICSVFDRDVNTVDDFQAAVKGIFLCGDFTDRAALLRLMNIDDVESGVGFTDSKSGPTRFPVGPYLVIPDQWQEFVPQIAISLDVNGESRQYSTGADMILTLNQIVARSLTESRDERWVYEGESVPLMEGHTFLEGQAILTGTPGGVIFQAPTTGFMISGIATWLVTFKFVNTDMMDYLVERLIEKHMQEKTHLYPGDVVDMSGSYLGTMQLQVADESAESAESTVNAADKVLAGK